MDELISVADFEAAARRSLDPGTDANYAGGAGDETALALAGARSAEELDASWPTRAPWA